MPAQQFDFIPPVIAHRGSSARAPENTLAAFEAAFADGAKWVEADIKLSSDGMPILMHDERLERTTNGRGAVADMNWADIRKLDAGRWFSPAFANTPVTAMAELLAFACATNLRLNLELKPCPGRTQATVMVALIEAVKLWPETAPPPLISSLDVNALMIATQMHPGWPRGLLLDEWREDWPDVVAQTQASTLNIREELLTSDILAQLRGASLPVLAYTVNDPARARHLLQNGVRAVFTDTPAVLLKG
jgi:glycerophosphoryl diester phosphodiesterase